MSEIEDRFYDEYEGAATFLVNECGMEQEHAENLLSDLLAAYALTLAEKVENQHMPPAVMAFGGTVAEVWRRAVNKSAELIRLKGARS